MANIIIWRILLYGEYYMSKSLKQYHISPAIKAKLYKLLGTTHTLFQQQGIEYWIDGGTILGAVRGKALIPWDDDVDISVIGDKSTIIKLNSSQLKTSLAKYGMEITKLWFGYKIFYTNGKSIKRNRWRDHKRKFKLRNPTITKRSEISKFASKTYKKTKKVSYETYTFPSLDIFLMKKEKKIVYINNKWSKCKYQTTDLFPLKLYKFGKLKVYGPNTPKPYLDGCYGDDWNIYGKMTYDHANEKIIKPVVVKL
jgi:phosphorylcholine metabolism protein LicD